LEAPPERSEGKEQADTSASAAAAAAKSRGLTAALTSAASEPKVVEHDVGNLL